MRSLRITSCRPGSHGFTLVEVLVTAGILAVLAGLVSVNLRSSWENERVLAVGNEFASWLNQVRTYSMRNNIACSVTITPAGNDSGESLASVNDLDLDDPANTCVPTEVGFNDNFLIPEMPNGRFDVDVNSAANDVVFTYTPRGATTNIDPITVRFRGRGQQNWLRCVQITQILGQVRVGEIVGNACMID